ncbi:hypothetical protein TNCV_5053291 [Trichonephila clavipes]|nr:hypothetical protein TNCV_5053291 [Trichonephila clavipes]
MGAISNQLMVMVLVNMSSLKSALNKLQIEQEAASTTPCYRIRLSTRVGVSLTVSGLLKRLIVFVPAVFASIDARVCV